MPTICASVGLPLEIWEKSKRYKINRSAIAKVAIRKEIERIERENGAAASKRTTPNTILEEGI